MNGTALGRINDIEKKLAAKPSPPREVVTPAPTTHSPPRLKAAPQAVAPAGSAAPVPSATTP